MRSSGAPLSLLYVIIYWKFDFEHSFNTTSIQNINGKAWKLTATFSYGNPPWYNKPDRATRCVICVIWNSIVDRLIQYRISPCPKKAENGSTDGRTDGPTDGRTDGQTLLLRCEDALKKRKNMYVVVVVVYLWNGARDWFACWPCLIVLLHHLAQYPMELWLNQMKREFTFQMFFFRILG